MISNREITLKVSKKHVTERLDRFICNYLQGISRTLIQRLIKDKQVFVNKQNSKSGYTLKENDVIFISLPDLKEPPVEAESIKLDIVYEDRHLIVVNKPQGMVTHPASRIYKGTLVNALLYHCKDSLSGINGVLRPGIVHRLDKETSGLIIACKNDKTHNEIAKQIKEKKLKRHYYAIVHGKVPYECGTINKPIGRHKIFRQKMAVVPNGRSAVTHWKVLKRFEKFTFLECTLETGRTHQIRVHMSSIGHPIIGDRTYGKKNDPIEQMMLHAYKLVFIHPKSKKEICFKIDIPERFIVLLAS